MSHGQKNLTMPFLYPMFAAARPPFRSSLKNISRARCSRRALSVAQTTQGGIPANPIILDTRLNPPPEEYARTLFVDKCSLSLRAGSGGHGCVSFLREKFIEFGPANGGDGGSGGNIYIQAVRGETSLHKLARRGMMKAGRGKNGQGKNKGGQRGEDVLLQVPVGTILREVSRYDPVTEQLEKEKLRAGMMETTEGDMYGESGRDKWILHPSSAPSRYENLEFPPLPRSRISNLALSQPAAPISLDLSEPMEKPMLLAAGAVGGLGNPHFVSQSVHRPKFATKGEIGMKIDVELELKLLADVGFVGLPNAGKSTLLRSLSKSRTRVGNWAFTTLQPNLGTVVLDNNHGRPKHQAYGPNGEPRTQFSVADIPGLVADAHLDRGLGLGFLRHVERARVLAFVIDLGAGDAVEALKALWKELREFETLKGIELNEQTQQRIVDWKSFGSSVSSASPQDGAVASARENIMINTSKSQALPELEMAPISSKPWFVVATKADLESTQDNFSKLQVYLEDVMKGIIEHPSGRKHAWKGTLNAIPVCAIRGEGVEKISEWTIALLSE